MADAEESQKPKSVRKRFGAKQDGTLELESESPEENALHNTDEAQAPSEQTEHEDPATDAAVDDIMKSDGDEALKAQDDAAEKAVVMKQGRGERFRNGWRRWWSTPRTRNSTIGVIVALLVVAGAVPFTRYNVLGLIAKASVTVTVVDSKTSAPVSGVSVKLGGLSAETDANGRATLKVHAGSRTLQVAKQYYKGAAQKELVALSNNRFKTTMVALGHPVQVKITNKITGKPVAGAVVTVQGAKAKTAASGMATVVLDSSATTQTASASGNGFNTATVTITANGDLAKNTFSITPAGKLYFLSNLSGKIDVVKTNLDGSDRQTVLAGTGNEDRYSTSLLASRDWKYLALLSKRSGDNASLYLIDTTNGDKLSTIDQGNASFTLAGWSGDRFIYQVNRPNVQNWEPNAQGLKSFDPTTGSTLSLDQTQASGSSAQWYARQNFNGVYIIGSQVVYVKNWQGNGIAPENVLAGKQAELDVINADGSGHRIIKTFGLDTYPPYTNGYTAIGIDVALYEPSSLYVAFSHDNTTNFYDYEDGKITPDTSMTSDKFNEAYGTTFLLSPSGGNTFWADQRDGKSTLFVGDDDGKNQKQIASLSEYNPYGWFTDSYLLVSKNSSELYIMPTTSGTPLKITDYYKPAINYQGYGGGYGGL